MKRGFASETTIKLGQRYNNCWSFLSFPLKESKESFQKSSNGKGSFSFVFILLNFLGIYSEEGSKYLSIYSQ